jgi:hypothetical protein
MFGIRNSYTNIRIFSLFHNIQSCMVMLELKVVGIQSNKVCDLHMEM